MHGFSWRLAPVGYAISPSGCQLLAATLLLFVALSPTDAGAAGFWNFGRGTSSFGRGGANIADPRDPLALYLNPAGLAGLKGLQIMFDGNWVLDNREFARVSDDVYGDGTNNYDPVKNSWRSASPSSGGFLSYNFASLGLESLSLGAGVYGPPRSDRVWPAEGSQRYNEVESHNLQIHYAFGAGYELPWYGIRIGATGMMISQIMNVDMRLNLITLGPVQESELYDASIHVEAREDWIPMGTFAISGRPISTVILSVSYQLPYDVSAAGTAGVEFGRGIVRPGTVPLAKVTGDAIGVILKMPAILRTAAQYRHPDNSFDVELAFVWEGWRRNDLIVFRPQNIVITQGISDIDLQDIIVDVHARDTGSLRLGGQYRVLPRLLTVRAGAYYERAAVGGGWLNAAFFDLDKIGGTVGARVDLPLDDWLGIPLAAWIDLAGGYAAWTEKTVDTAKAHIANPLADPASDPDICDVNNSVDVPCWPLSNGTYSNHVIVAMASLGVWFDI